MVEMSPIIPKKLKYNKKLKFIKLLLITSKVGPTLRDKFKWPSSLMGT